MEATGRGARTARATTSRRVHGSINIRYMCTDLEIRDLLHGKVDVGRPAVKLSLKGVADEVATMMDPRNGRRKDGNVFLFVERGCMVNREEDPRRQPRWDIKLTSLWVSEQLQKRGALYKVEEWIREELTKVPGPKKGWKIEWHVQRVPTGARGQEMHTDVPEKVKYYYTAIVPLVSDPEAGGTIFDGHFGNRPVSPFLGAVMFHGHVLHRGSPNASKGIRYFLYAAILAKGQADPNC